MYVKESGTQGAPTIVFLHGMGTSSWMWEAQTQDLSDFHCLNFDLPGHGKSNHIPWLSLDDTADQIAALIETRATKQRAYVVGLSLGAYVTLHLLKRHAARVERAVLSGVTTAPLPNKGLMSIQAQVISFMLKRAWFIRAQAKMLRMPDDVIASYTESMMSMSRKTFLDIFNEVINFRLPKELSQVNVPMLVTAGSEEMKPVLDAVIEIASTLPNAEARLAPGGHHGWNGEAPELFSAMLRAWFTAMPLPAELQQPELVRVKV